MRAAARLLALFPALLGACGAPDLAHDVTDQPLSEEKNRVLFRAVEKSAGYRIPTLAQLKAGAIVVIAEKRLGGVNQEGRRTSIHLDGGNVSLVGRVSLNAGATWGDEIPLVTHEDLRRMLTTRFRDHAIRPRASESQADIDALILRDFARVHVRLVDPTVVALSTGSELLVVFRAMYNTLYDEDDKVWSAEGRLSLNDLGRFSMSVRNTLWAARFALEGAVLRRVAIERLDETAVSAALRERGLIGRRIDALYRSSFLPADPGDFLAGQRSWQTLYGTMVSGTSASGEDVLLANPRGVYHHLDDLRRRCAEAQPPPEEAARCGELFSALLAALELEPTELKNVRAEVVRYSAEIRELLTSAKRLGPGKGVRLGTRLELAGFPVHLSGEESGGGVSFKARPLPELTTEGFKPNERALTTFKADANADGRAETYALYSYNANVGPHTWRTAPDEKLFRRGFGWGKFVTDTNGERVCSWAPPRPDPLMYDSIVVGGVATVRHEGQEYVISATNYVRNLESEILCRERAAGRCTEWDNRRMLALTVGKASMKAEAAGPLSLHLGWYLTHDDCSRALGPNSAQTIITRGSAGNMTLVHDAGIDSTRLHVIYEGHPDGEFTDLGFAEAILYRSLPVAEVVGRALRINRFVEGCRPGTQ